LVEKRRVQSQAISAFLFREPRFVFRVSSISQVSDFSKGRVVPKIVGTSDRALASEASRTTMVCRVRRLPPRAPRVLALALLVSAFVSGANAEATKWTPGEFERSLFATRGSNTPTAADDDVTATPHLLKLYAPWCGHCKKMAPAFDEAATVLKMRNMEVGKVDCADRQSGGVEFCAKLNVRGFPQVKLFLGTEDALVDFPMSGDRSSAAMVAFALGGHAARPRQYFREVPRSVRVPEVSGSDDGDDEDSSEETVSTIALVPKTGVERWRDFALDVALDVAEDVFACLKNHRLGSLAIFSAAFFVALFGIILTDLVSERIGVPRRGESWDQMRERAEWAAERASRKEKEAKKADDGKKTR
jgi:thiol-disulfide isomerase/thioredoxin